MKRIGMYRLQSTLACTGEPLLSSGWYCVSATPAASTSSEAHLQGEQLMSVRRNSGQIQHAYCVHENRFCKIHMENMAVVRSLLCEGAGQQEEPSTYSIEERTW